MNWENKAKLRTGDISLIGIDGAGFSSHFVYSRASHPLPPAAQLPKYSILFSRAPESTLTIRRE